ncbi:hypothetical protein VF12_40945 [Nostoc linckia z15]|nr:hypothetical protein VF12_40945 [Nostoc linckia z15]
MKGKLLTLLGFIFFFMAFFYLADRCRQEDIRDINTNPAYTKGIVIKKTTYKGRHIRIKYFVGGKQYIESAGFEEDDNIEVGDSIALKYSINNPELIITQFNENY